MFDLVERRWASKPQVLRLLADMRASGECRSTLFFTPASLEGRPVDGPFQSSRDELGSVFRQVGEPETGLVLFLEHGRVVAVVPPFPIREDFSGEGMTAEPLVDLLNVDLTVGVVLIRMGRYAVGVLRGEGLLSSKTGSRYVKSRHRAGGSSQRRFERSRERLVRELFDRACMAAKDVFEPYASGMDYVLTGGERHTVKGFLSRCGYLRGLEQKTLTRLLQVHRPGLEPLRNISLEVWKSRVLIFQAAAIV